MQPKSYQSLDQKPYDSHYLLAETVIDHPVKKVWPHALNIGGWMSAHRLETIAGQPGEAGHFERVYPRGLGRDVGFPHYHMYGLAHVIPCKYIALEVFPEKGGSYGNAREYMSFDGILLDDVGGKTKITFLLVDIHLGKGDQAAYERRRKEIEDSRQLLDQYFENLRILVHTGS